MDENKVKKMIDDAIMRHIHDGNLSQQIQLQDIFDMVRTVDSATDFANIVAETPTNLYEQLLIDTSTATKKLYIYDTIGGVWYSVTIT